MNFIYFSAPCSSQSFSTDTTEGVALHHVIASMPCTYALAAKTSQDQNISKCLEFDPNSNGEIPWNQLYDNGKFDTIPNMKTRHTNDELACGIACQSTIAPSQKKNYEMSLSWNMPVVTFINKIKKHSRFYTKYFGSESAAAQIGEYALTNYNDWEKKIYEWQKPILDDE